MNGSRQSGAANAKEKEKEVEWEEQLKGGDAEFTCEAGIPVGLEDKQEVLALCSHGGKHGN